MQNFTTCIEEIFEDIIQILPLKSADRRQEINSISNKRIAERVRELIPIEELKTNGAFFTGDELADLASKRLGNISENSKILDPACGAGNLLLSCLNFLPVEQRLGSTLRLWGVILHGYDLHDEFITATKLRIIHKAIQRVEIVDLEDIEEMMSFLPNIIKDNYFSSTGINNYSHIFMNPPFIKIRPEHDIEWAKGAINSASLFVEKSLSELCFDGIFIAILPEVLYSGTRYKMWREFLARNLSGIEVSQRARFDKKTDVDTFILSGIKALNNSDHSWLETKKTKRDIVEEFFNISVGSVVPHRDKEEGEKHPFLCVKNSPKWEELFSENIKLFREYTGRLVKPPFIVIRRTSSPADRFRAVSTLIKGSEKVAVENHLIIVEPKTGDVRDCEVLLKTLRSERTNNYLNDRIRCRHLTVGAVKEIPLHGAVDGC